MKLQKYRNGHIYKERNKLIYRTESGKTERSYDSIKELLEGENGTSYKAATQEADEETTPEVVAETTPEEQIDES